MGELTLADTDLLLAELPLSNDGTGHIADCGYTHEKPTCGCYTLRPRLAAAVDRLISRHVSAALTAAADEIEAKADEWGREFSATGSDADYGRLDGWTNAALILRNQATR